MGWKFGRALTLGSFLISASGFLTPPSIAQESASDVIEEIVVIGTRRLNRTVANSPVPVDVFQGAELENIGTGDMDDILRRLVPSYNVERYPLNDESSLVRPATLRGLPPDNTLILVNGKRRHRSGVLATAAGGAQGPDISVLPAIALRRLEVLRDGASAQYGSDAIAGVMNFVMRDNAEGTIVEYKFGEFYEGDGRSNKIGINRGITLGLDGFLNLSLEYRDVESTSRAEQRFDASALDALGQPGVPNPAQNYGQPKIDNEVKLFVNTAMAIGENSEIYGFGNYADRSVEIEFFWRNPVQFSNVFTSSPDRLVFDLTGDNSGNCPTAGTAAAIQPPNRFFPTQQEYDADQINLTALAADPDCWTVNELYPNGYRPDYGADIRDSSAVVGFRGFAKNGFRFDLSTGYGENEVRYTLANTLNPSLGPNTPTSFHPGDSIQTEVNLNADFAWPVEFGGFYSPLNVAFGAEWREEQFETVAGDSESWAVGPLFAQGASIGSNGFPGFPPQQAGTWERANTAIYLDLEADVTENLLLGTAVRSENFDDFGSTTNVKGVFRYRINDTFSLRGSVSTGFRAPTPGQANATRTTGTTFNGQLVQGGQIPPTNPVAMFFGGRELKPEESESLSIGFTLEPLDNLTITADYFRVDVDDRISIGQNFGLSAQDVADLVALGVPGASDFRFVNFFGNGTNTETDGIDLIATYSIAWKSIGDTEISFAWNRTETEVVSQLTPNRRFVVNLENRPKDRTILSVNHYVENWRFLVRASWYDDWVDSDTNSGTFDPICTKIRRNPSGTDKCYGDTWLVDLEAAYTLNDRWSLIVGADNVFDEVPETDYDFPGFSFGVIYPRRSPIGYHGGFWYARLRAEF